MDVKIYPSKLIGTLNAPSSKSYSHRMIIAAALAGGISEISNVTGSNDIKVTAGAMEALGADVLADGGTGHKCHIQRSRKAARKALHPLCPRIFKKGDLL